jgi:hypothetical protein
VLPKRQSSLLPSSIVYQRAPSPAASGGMSSVFASFGRAFALHGTSYCNLLHAIATSPIGSCSIETEAEKLSVRERRRSLAVISSSESPKLTEVELEQEASRAGPGSEERSEDAGLAEFYNSASFTDRSTTVIG